jgi:hypothetical protein
MTFMGDGPQDSTDGFWARLTAASVAAVLKDDNDTTTSWLCS